MSFAFSKVVGRWPSNVQGGHELQCRSRDGSRRGQSREQCMWIFAARFGGMTGMVFRSGGSNFECRARCGTLLKHQFPSAVVQADIRNWKILQVQHYLENMLKWLGSPRLATICDAYFFLNKQLNFEQHERTLSSILVQSSNTKDRSFAPWPNKNAPKRLMNFWNIHINKSLRFAAVVVQPMNTELFSQKHLRRTQDVERSSFEYVVNPTEVWTCFTTKFANLETQCLGYLGIMFWFWGRKM